MFHHRVDNVFRPQDIAYCRDIRITYILEDEICEQRIPECRTDRRESLAAEEFVACVILREFESFGTDFLRSQAQT